MNKYEMEDFRNSEAFYLLPIIHDGLFHCVEKQAFLGIMTDGFIFPNQGQFVETYPQTKNNYGYSHGWISLFDFKSVSEEKCIEQCHNWPQFFIYNRPIKGRIVLRLKREFLIERIIPSTSRPQRGEPNYKFAIDYLECWYPDQIPVSYIDYCLILESSNNIIRKTQYTTNDLFDFFKKHP